MNRHVVYRMIAWIGVVVLAGATGASGLSADTWPGFTRSPHFQEQHREVHFDSGVRLLIIAPQPQGLDPAKPARVVFFATPNGNSVEQTLGCRMADGLDWHYDIQHIAAQHRAYRNANKRENLVLVCLQSDLRSWPTWRKRHEHNAELIRRIVADTLTMIPLQDPTVTLSSHSGGGSFLSGFLNGSDAIPDWVDRFIYLDSNYSYSDEQGHGNKFVQWLAGDADRRLIVVAYDDREITYKGKKIVGPTGGTFRATHRMLDRFRQEGDVVEDTVGPFNAYHALGGQAHLLIHPNEENIIQHTRMVGEMNGQLWATVVDTPERDAVAPIGPPRAYMQWVQPLPFDYEPGAMPAASDRLAIPARPDGALDGRAFMKRIETLPPAERDAAIRDELLAGNVPTFLRRFVAVHTRAKIADDSEVSATFEVSPDYLAVGSDEDYVRVPVTPMTAHAVAEAFGCTLPTVRMVDEIYAQAPFKLAPLPLTEARESVTSFLQHNGLIQWQLEDKRPGELIAGIKKDIVLTNRLRERPDRVAIYGWHRLSGRPIQPLTTVHVNTYVDYSHGVRLVKQTLRVGDEVKTVAEVLADENLAPLLSDEGVITGSYE